MSPSYQYHCKSTPYSNHVYSKSLNHSSSNVLHKRFLNAFPLSKPPTLPLHIYNIQSSTPPPKKKTPTHKNPQKTISATQRWGNLPKRIRCFITRDSNPGPQVRPGVRRYSDCATAATIKGNLFETIIKL